MEGLYIERIQIKNFLQQGNIDWQLKRDVNVLVGENGTGKTTLLNLLEAALYPANQILNQSIFANISEMRITFNANRWIEIAPTAPQGGWERHLYNLNESDINALQTKKISTFDIAISIDKAGTYNLLNLLFADLKTLFFQSRSNAFEQLTKEDRTDEEKKKADGTIENHRLFTKIINELFANPKTANAKKFNPQTFQFDKEGISLTVEQLSSGEKQLLLLLITTLIQDHNNTILLMDEPEISLHISWQRRLLKDLHSLNPNCQQIIVTHSPTLFFKDYVEHFQKLEDILTTKDIGTIVSVKKDDFDLYLYKFYQTHNTLQKGLNLSFIKERIIDFWKISKIKISIEKMRDILFLSICMLEQIKSFNEINFLSRKIISKLNVCSENEFDFWIDFDLYSFYLLINKCDTFLKYRIFSSKEPFPTNYNSNIFIFIKYINKSETLAEVLEIEALRVQHNIPKNLIYSELLDLKQNTLK